MPDEKAIRNFFIKAVTGTKILKNERQEICHVKSFRLKDGDAPQFFDIFEGRTRLMDGLTIDDIQRGLQVDVYYREKPSNKSTKVFLEATKIFRSKPKPQIMAPAQNKEGKE